MILFSKKTWSRQLISIHGRIGDKKSDRFLSSEKQAMLLLAMKTAIAAGLSYWIARQAGLTDGYWGSISAIIVLQSNVGSTISASRDRLVGTLIGAAFGAVFSLFGDSIWIYLIAVMTAMVTCSLLGLKNSSRLAAVTVTIIMLVHRTGTGFWSNWVLPMHRVVEVLLGIIVALITAAVIYPSRARARLCDGLAQQFLLLGAAFHAITQPLLSSTRGVAENRYWTQISSSAEANELLLTAARNEPAGSAASLESLSLLHQFAQELIDSLRALELAVDSLDADKNPSSYMQRLEPELGALIQSLELSFEEIGRCIHDWNFERAAPGVPLEEDTSRLDQKIAELRSQTAQFPQPEILQAYAVQLHLRQLVRLLHSARAETAKTA